MVEPLGFDNVKVEFLYPFKISGWLPLREYFISYLADRDRLTAYDGAVATGSFVETMSVNPIACNISNNLRFMEMLSYNINRLSKSDDGLLWATCHSHERRGTRPYCIKDEPFIILCLKGHELELLNPERLPDLRRRLPELKIRSRTTVKLLYSGFGMTTIKFHLLTPAALEAAIADIVYSSAHEPSEAEAALTQEIIFEAPAAIKYQDTSGILDILKKYALPPIDENELASRLSRLVEEVTLINGPLTVDQVVDLQNLDRGADWDREPHFSWPGSQDTGAPKLYHYFLSMLEKDVISRVKEAVASNGSYAKRLTLTTDLLHSSDWHAAEGEFPYVLTTVTAPDSWRKQPSANLAETAEYMKTKLFSHRNEVARLLIKSKWQSVRADWGPIKDALTNVFYSDLLYMAVHLRGALCIYYLPVDPYLEYKRSPELLGSAKYREEFKITLSDQRVLWFIYTMQNQLISRDMTDISKHYEELRAKNREENFPEIFDGLSHIVTTIENRKVALAEVMEDPLSRRGGSSLFAEMIDASSRAFRLHELYDSLKHKLERLDMLGLHVSEGIHEASNLIVSESSRGAQTTLEILESMILGIYVSELVKSAAESYHEEHGFFPFPLNQWWVFVLIGMATFLMALPWVTLVRKFRTRIPISEPAFQERLEAVFANVGPAVLGATLYFVLAGSIRLDISALLMSASITVIPISAWWIFTDRYEKRSESINLFGQPPKRDLSKIS